MVSFGCTNACSHSQKLHVPPGIHKSETRAVISCPYDRVQMARTRTAQPPTGARQPLAAAIAAADKAKTGSFAKVEPIFLNAIWQFDQHVAAGLANQGDIQNGKGDFLNDFLGVLLKHGSGKQVVARGGVPGLSFRSHFLDCSYPAAGDVTFVVETKATGIPKHPRNPRQANPDGRPGAADLEKRVKEAALKNIDIKAETARRAGTGHGATGDLISFLRKTPPLTCMFITSRVVDAADLVRVEHYARIAQVWFDYCGIYCYGLDKARTAYEAKQVHTTLELDRVLSQVETALRALP